VLDPVLKHGRPRVLQLDIG
jgi:homoserine acetyltransferase